jgi:DNA polymerase delta subunit 1
VRAHTHPQGAKTYEKAEDPIYALEHNLPIDTAHYLEHHLAQPLMRIFEPVMKNPKVGGREKGSASDRE